MENVLTFHAYCAMLLVGTLTVAVSDVTSGLLALAGCEVPSLFAMCSQPKKFQAILRDYTSP